MDVPSLNFSRSCSLSFSTVGGWLRLVYSLLSHFGGGDHASALSVASVAVFAAEDRHAAHVGDVRFPRRRPVMMPMPPVFVVVAGMMAPAAAAAAAAAAVVVVVDLLLR